MNSRMIFFIRSAIKTVRAREYYEKIVRCYRHYCCGGIARYGHGRASPEIGEAEEDENDFALT